MTAAVRYLILESMSDVLLYFRTEERTWTWRGQNSDVVVVGSAKTCFYAFAKFILMKLLKAVLLLRLI